jgi:HSP20 family protein
MDYIKIRFGNDIEQVDTKFKQTIDEMFRSMNPIFSCSECLWKPQMDIYESSDEIIILAEISGVNKEDLEIEISHKAVKLSGKRTPAISEEKVSYRLAEIQFGTFERTLFLPASINTDKVSASYSNGFLKLSLAKLNINGTKTITINDE